MSSEIEKVKRAKNAFGKCYRPLLKDLVFNLSVGLSKRESKFALDVRCQFEDLDSVTEETEAQVREILGTSFEFEGDTYPLDVVLASIPIAQRNREKR